ncbi:MAG: hypothetical protein M3451_02225 [Chloroflexota bacterium]|nr:hypothetical protein [Chloroflexota bacterium]
MAAWTRRIFFLAVAVVCLGSNVGVVNSQSPQTHRASGVYESPIESRAVTETRTSHETITPSMRSAQSTNLDCTIVELYPGYPGYRGNITGVMPHYGGLGDYECMHILEQDFPQFDRAQEDRANQQAADALGINGPMNLWTWENWMLIEAERGLVPSCYTCLMLDTTSTPHRMNVYPDPDDYRILTGFIGQTTSLTAISSSIGFDIPMGLDGILDFYGYDDYVLRAVAYLYGGPTLNAQELYEEMQR